MLIAWTCLYLNDYIIFQVLILFLASLLVTVYYVTVKPFEQEIMYYLELYNEFSIALCL